MFTSIHELSDFLQLSTLQRTQLVQLPPFPLLIPKRLAAKIQKQTLDDPILRQFVPFDAENTNPDGFTANPVGDQEARLAPKLLKKYKGRALLITSSACAMNCRFCFRREFDYQTSKNFDQEIEAIRNDTSLKEIILSGGDPLSLSNIALNRLLSELEAIPHITRIRFHTRYPLGFPERIDREFLKLFEKRFQFWFVIHCNHPLELDQDVLQALQKIPAPLLCQTVLLRGVNDDLSTLKALCEHLIDNGIFPYYLHQLDRVSGASHFEVEKSKGMQLIKALEQELSGYGVPRFVQELSGEASKTPLTI